MWAFMMSFVSVLFNLYLMHIYLPVHPRNLRDAVRATSQLPMTAGICFACSAWGIFLGMTCESLRPLQGTEYFWLFREQELHWSARMVPFLVLFVMFLVFLVPFFVQISATARLIAHSGAIGDKQVLPTEAYSWSMSDTKRSLAGLALSHPDLKDLYIGQLAGPRDQARQPARGFISRMLFGLGKRRSISV